MLSVECTKNTSYSCYYVAHGLFSIMRLYIYRYKLLTLTLSHRLLKYNVLDCPELIERLHFRANLLDAIEIIHYFTYLIFQKNVCPYSRFIF